MRTAEVLDQLDEAARHLETPCGTGRMVWRVWGSGPPLVLLHGGYGSWRHWVRTIPYFRPTRTVFVPDIPGLGDSDTPPEPASLFTIGGIIAEGLQHLGLGAEADLVGFSFGAVVGGHVAAQCERLASFTMVGAGALGLPRTEILLERHDQVTTAAEKRAIHRHNLALLMFADPEKIDELAVDIQDINVGLARIKSRRFAHSSVLADVLPQCRADALFAIWGDKDPVAAPHFAEREALLRSIRPDVVVTLIPGAGHWLPYEAADRFNPLLSRLIGRHPTGN
jgi:pimeloyl-ACP methyl ester carboxylesterase